MPLVLARLAVAALLAGIVYAFATACEAELADQDRCAAHCSEHGFDGSESHRGSCVCVNFSAAWEAR